MDLSSVVKSFALPPVTLIRQAPGVYDPHGRWVAGATTEIQRSMIIAPATPRDLQVLPEGLRTEETLAFFDIEELRTATAGTNGTAADRVVYNGATYELHHVDNWSHQAGYWRAIGIKVGQ